MKEKNKGGFMTIDDAMKARRAARKAYFDRCKVVIERQMITQDLWPERLVLPRPEGENEEAALRDVIDMICQLNPNDIQIVHDEAES